jgi:hypothetical protein
VSFEEFLSMFRKENKKRTEELARDLAHLPSGTDSQRNSKQESLVGLDAKIPGGKYDSTTYTDAAMA